VSKSAGAFLTKAKEGLESATMLIMVRAKCHHVKWSAALFFVKLFLSGFFFLSGCSRFCRSFTMCATSSGRAPCAESFPWLFEPGVFLALLFVVLEGICVDIAPEGFFWRGVFFWLCLEEAYCLRAVVQYHLLLFLAVGRGLVGANTSMRMYRRDGPSFRIMKKFFFVNINSIQYCLPKV